MIDARSKGPSLMIIMSSHALALALIGRLEFASLTAVVLLLAVCCSAIVALRQVFVFANHVRRVGWSERGGWWLEDADGRIVSVAVEERACFGYALIAMVWRDHKGQKYRLLIAPGAMSARNRRRLAAYLRWGPIAENTDQFEKNFPTAAGSMTVAGRRTR